MKASGNNLERLYGTQQEERIMENIIELVRSRRSVRTFDGKEVCEDDRKKLALFMEKIENPYGIPVSFKFLDGKK